MKTILMMFFYLLNMPPLNAGENLEYHTKNFSKFARRLMHESGESEDSKLYIVYLADVKTYLPEREKVKRKKINLMANRLIPGKTPICLARKMIYHSKQTLETKSALAFFSDLRKDQQHTYAILNDRIIFTETTNVPVQEKYKDKFSKHGLISGLKRKVHFAGEFKVVERDDKITVIINNNSGTYRPKKENLNQLKKLLESNFLDERLDFIAQNYDENLEP